MSARVHGALLIERVARKQHHCGWDCGDPIKPGERYIRSSMPPWTEPNESPHWRTHALHGADLYDCPTYKRRDAAERGPSAAQHVA
jgi:hypothetical protein